MTTNAYNKAEIIAALTKAMDEIAIRPEDRADVLTEVISEFRSQANPSSEQRASPRWEDRDDTELGITPEDFVLKYYYAEKAAVTPRPIWDKDGSYGNRPAEFIAKAYLPEMKAGTLHRALIGQDNPDLPAKLVSWLRSHPMPEGLDIPTKPEWHNRQLERLKQRELPVKPTRLSTTQSRLYDALRHRTKPG